MLELHGVRGWAAVARVVVPDRGLIELLSCRRPGCRILTLAGRLRLRRLPAASWRRLRHRRGPRKRWPRATVGARTAISRYQPGGGSRAGRRWRQRRPGPRPWRRAGHRHAIRTTYQRTPICRRRVLLQYPLSDIRHRRLRLHRRLEVRPRPLGPRRRGLPSPPDGPRRLRCLRRHRLPRRLVLYNLPDDLLRLTPARGVRHQAFPGPGSHWDVDAGHDLPHMGGNRHRQHSAPPPQHTKAQHLCPSSHPCSVPPSPISRAR